MLQDKFSNWQNSEIYTIKFGYIQKNTLISNFIKNGIYPFIVSNKYQWNISIKELENIIGTILFYTENNIKFKFPYFNFYEEPYEDFNFYIDWNTLWYYWNHNSNNYLYEYNELLQALICHYINLEKSEAYLNTIESDGENEDDSKKKEKYIDPYILDQLNKTYNRKKYDL
jgi:hypothetical protein